MPSSSPMVVVARAAGRAVVGAVAGLILTLLVLLFAGGVFRLVASREPVIGDTVVPQFLGAGAARTAGLAVARGRASVSRRAGLIVVGLMIGAFCGIVLKAVIVQIDNAP